MIAVYSPVESARLNYVIDFLARELFAEPILRFTDSAEFLSKPVPRIQYGGQRLSGDVFYIAAASLLFEKDISPQETSCFEVDGMTAFYQTGGDLSFDMFAAIFFLLSRYEEWLPYRADEYGRFPAEASLASKNKFLQTPLVDEWLRFFQIRLLAVFPALPFRLRSFRLRPTYDIDMAWSYRGKGLLRNAGGFFRDLVKGSFHLLHERASVLAGLRPDPFDVFSWLDELHERSRVKPCYFFLLAAAVSRLDKNILPEKPVLRELVKNLSRRYETGIHPSFQSGENDVLLSEEKKTLETITGRQVNKSRQHYLRLSMPVTYRKLIQAGILNDFSMGYGSVNGFRASYTGDFYWYDLEKESQTGLLLTPFCFMDATAFHVEKMDAAAAREQLRSMRETIMRVGGCMTTVWHNHYLGLSAVNNAWRETYQTFLLETSAST